MRAQTAVSFRHGRGAGRVGEPVVEGKRHAGLSHREMKSIAIRSRTMDFNGCAANAADTAALNTMTTSTNVPARMSCTVEWLSSSRTTEGLPSGASVAGSGRGLEVPAEIRWVGMNSRMCRNAQRTFCGCCQFDTLTRTSVGGGNPPGPLDHCHRSSGIAGARSSLHRPSEA